MDGIDKAYYLHEEELAILLSLYGQQELYGYSLYSIDILKREDVYQALYKMKNKDILYISGEAMYAMEPWESIIRQMIMARRLIVCADANKMHEELFLYISDRTVAVHTQGMNRGMLRIMMWANDTVAYHVIQHGVQLESFMERNVEGMVLSVEERTKLFKKAKNRFSRPLIENLKEKDILFLLINYDVSAREKIGEITVMNQGIEDYLISFGEMCESRIYPYSENKLKSLINEWIEGGG